jgi:UDP-N-acetylmuramoyl-tripeptide--D-alanyl-D-alanine ligase
VKLPLGRIAEIVSVDGSARGSFDPRLEALGYSIDSRTIAPGELFFAIRGEQFDGHDFVAAAFERGAIATVVARNVALVSRPAFSSLLVVPDPLRALQTLAAAVRRLWGKPLVAVTGSAGKTTTKEMIACVLGARYSVVKSDGNLNNHFGLPLQLLRLQPEHELAVMELGMNHAGEITALARLAAPNMGIVTNVGPVHLEFFRSVAEIAAAKKELIDALPSNGTAILNADDEYVSHFGKDFSGKVVTFGMSDAADVRADKLIDGGILGSKFDLVSPVGCDPMKLPVAGRHNVYNALAAMAVGLQFHVDVASAATALANFQAVEKRGSVIEIAGVTIVNDCYNSNPRALDSMVDALASTPMAPGGRRIAVAGEMLELGPAGEELHRRCGRHMANKKIDVVLGVRGLAKLIVEGACQEHAPPVESAEFFELPEAAAEWLARETRAGDLVLLKGSRGVRLERALETWRALAETNPAQSHRDTEKKGEQSLPRIFTDSHG